MTEYPDTNNLYYNIGGSTMQELKQSYLVEIDGVPMPDPITYELPLDDLDSSDSSLSGNWIQPVYPA